MGEILATIITGAGVILTVIVSSFFSWKKVNVELNSLKQQNQLAYATQLLEKRHASYPKIYNIIIGFINSVRAKDIERENLIELYHQLTEWDQLNSIFLSARSQFRFFHLLKSIRTVVNNNANHPSWEERKNILEDIRKVELALKSDLGVFIVEFSGAPEGFFDDYTNLFEEAKKEDMKLQGAEEAQDEPATSAVVTKKNHESKKQSVTVEIEKLEITVEDEVIEREEGSING